MMRCIYIPISPTRREQWGMQEAFVRLYDSDVFDFIKLYYARVPRSEIDQEFLELVEQNQPELIHLHVGYGSKLKNDWLRIARKIVPEVVITNWFGDWREDVGEVVKERFSLGDAALLCNKDPENIEFFKSAARSVYYSQTAVARATPHPDRTRWPQDVVYSNNFRPRGSFENTTKRNDLFRLIRERYGTDAGLWGHSWDIDGINESRYHDQLDLYASAKVAVSFNNMHRAWCHSTRLLFCLYSGTCTVSDRFPGCEDIFRDGEEILYFDHDNINECIEKIDWALGHPEEAERIGNRGRAAVEAGHLWDHRVREIVEEIVPAIREERMMKNAA